MALYGPNVAPPVPVMTGTFLIHNHSALILFDSGASHSFIGSKTSDKYGLKECQTKGSFMISTPGGKITSDKMNVNVPIKLGQTLFRPRSFSVDWFLSWNSS